MEKKLIVEIAEGLGNQFLCMPMLSQWQKNLIMIFLLIIKAHIH